VNQTIEDNKEWVGFPSELFIQEKKDKFMKRCVPISLGYFSISNPGMSKKGR